MKVLASDYDGTIKINNRISYRTIKAIQKWRKQGNVFGIVTGRTIVSIQRELKRFSIQVDFLIGNNGAIILDRQQHVLQKNLASYPVCMDLIERIHNFPLKACVISNGFDRAKVMTSKQYQAHLFGNWSRTFTYEDVKEQQEITQVILSTQGGSLENEALAKQINEWYEDELKAYSNRSCVDVVAKDINKASGVAFIQRYLHIEKDNVFVIGDACNDVPMLIQFKSATLQHASMEVQKKAGIVVKDVATFIELIQSN